MDNFIVSARKYRPATFVSVIGQQHITSTLKNAIARGQLAHAYLFCGPRGVGKTTCARIFAKAINCLSPVEGESCNECESCKAFNEGRSFSIHELDAASNNSVDDIRNLTEQVRIPPQVGRYSIYIIDEVHMLSLSAFNAFLKTLEEPPAHAIFILATTEKHKIIPTILSRCQIYDFNRIKPDDATEYLKFISEQEGVQCEEEALHIIARKADGGMRDALSMFDKVVSFCGSKLDSATVSETLNVLDYDTYFKISGYISSGDYQGCLLLLDDILRRGFSVQTFIAGLNDHFRNLLMCKDKRTNSLLEVSGKTAEHYFAQAEKFTTGIIVEGISLMTSTDSGLRNSSNQRLNAELALLKLCGLFQKKTHDITGNDSIAQLIIPSASSTTTNSNTATPVQNNPTPEVPVEAPANPEHKTEPAIEVTATCSTAKEPDKEDITPARQQSQQKKKEQSVTGFSLKNIMNGNSQPEEIKSEITDVREEPENSGQINKKILEEACAKLSDELSAERPRLAAAFKDVSISENCVKFTVSNETLKDEIVLNTLDLKKRLSELGSYRGTVEFHIEIKEDNRPMRPIKAEDKLKYLSEINPQLNDLRKALNLDIE
ncbi:MAG: DNA polymerase III subunit gamma/tau [Rikenellaceae bacterium]|nr:DNA polymerase III subunit gamma/tau [Rikenellaceae bacterium]